METSIFPGGGGCSPLFTVTQVIKVSEVEASYHNPPPPPPSLRQPVYGTIKMIYYILEHDGVYCGVYQLPMFAYVVRIYT